MACHTERGGEPYAGGRAIDTPFGTVYASNLTPEATTGLGAWSAEVFRRALHEGRSRDGRLLVPVFPYNSYTHISRDDSDALYAFLRSLPPVVQVNPPHHLRWPYDTQWALALWRTLHETPTALEPDAQRSAEWNRGQYLVRGLGHCGECHTPRNVIRGPERSRSLAGGPAPEGPRAIPNITLPGNEIFATFGKSAGRPVGMPATLGVSRNAWSGSANSGSVQAMQGKPPRTQEPSPYQGRTLQSACAWVPRQPRFSIKQP